MKPQRLFLSLAGLIILTGVVFADGIAAPLLGSSETCQAYAGSNACSKKAVASTGSTTWGGNVYSEMKNPRINIGVIGEAYWTVRETCNGAITSQSQYGGEADYGDYLFLDSSAQLKHTCGGTRVGWSLGNHDYNQSGYSHITPYKEYHLTIN